MKKLPGQKRKELIIQTAMKLFAQNGFSGTTTKDIAKASKISEALLFKFFPTKHSLYSAMINYRIKQVGNSYNLQQLFDKPSKEFFKEIVKFHIENIEKDDTFMRILLFSALEGHSLFDQFYKIKIYKIVLKIADYIRIKIDKGEFKNLNPTLAARMLMGMTYNYLLSKKIFKIKNPANFTTDEIADIIVDIFLNGITKR